MHPSVDWVVCICVHIATQVCIYVCGCMLPLAGALARTVSSSLVLAVLLLVEWRRVAERGPCSVLSPGAALPRAALARGVALAVEVAAGLTGSL